MAIDDKAREDHDRGGADAKLGTFDRLVNDVFVTHPDTNAYYKGREGEDLDSDKSDSKK
jgi:hypothetical protein